MAIPKDRRYYYESSGYKWQPSHGEWKYRPNSQPIPGGDERSGADVDLYYTRNMNIGTVQWKNELLV